MHIIQILAQNLDNLGLIILTFLFINISLSITYKAFKINWPNLYYPIEDKSAFLISTSLNRWLTFKFLPVFIATIFALGVFMRNTNPTLTLTTSIISVLFYSLLTDGRAIIRILFNSPNIKIYFNKPAQLLQHLFTIAVFIFISIISAPFSKLPIILFIIPSPQGLVDNLWSAFLAVVIVIHYKEILTGGNLTDEMVIMKSKKNISPEILNHIEIASKAANANKYLVEAICIAENLQRPRWVRIIESIYGLFHKVGTYGIMQIKSDHVISDIESIDIAIAQRFKDTATIKDSEGIKKIILKYNNDDRYCDLVVKIIYFLGFQFTIPENEQYSFPD